MITTYDLDSCSKIELDGPGAPESMPESGFATALELQLVEVSALLEKPEPDFGAVIAAQVLANLSRD